ncbi:NADH-quinone oxidoreductase subunit C [Kribbia dieselivorans]|uniref:NADH-quinone oxidoreductase subunit C n=1 Tax=Kribbia dieselivorans TaxID=331526 RepID=UPI0009F94B1E|nr:NADH-quinone oxidoreductase subunit C [Kribbia dieselivorans]
MSENPTNDTSKAADLTAERVETAQAQAEQGVTQPAAEQVDTTPVVVARRQGMFGATDGSDTSGYGGLHREILFPGAAQRPYGGWFDGVVDELATHTPAEAVERVVVDRGELTLHVRPEHLLAVVGALRDAPALRFEMCTSVSGVHYPEYTGSELHAVYHFMSLTHGARRLRVEVGVPQARPEIPSIISVYPAADWHERETWDMFGIIFTGRESLTRILMPDDWPGHPQRKDYPLGGIPVEYKGGTVPPPDQRRSYK